MPSRTIHAASAGTTPHDEQHPWALPALLAGFSIEITPREALAAPGALRLLPPGTSVYLPYLRTVPFQQTLHAARIVSDAGCAPVPHVAARALSGAGALHDMLAALAGEAGVAQLLLVGGDLPQAAGPYASALDVLRTGALARHGMREVAFAGYPEGHPSIPDGALDEARRDKLACAVEQGLGVRWLTQLCFTAAPVAAWIRNTRARAPQARVDAGVHGVTSVRQLLRYGRLCGVGASMRALARDHRRVFSLHARGDPLRMLRELAELRQTSPISVPSRVHFFSLGAFAATAAWANAVARGEGGTA